MLGLGVLVLAFAAWVGFRTYFAYRHLDAAARVVSQVQANISTEAIPASESLSASILQLQEEAADANDDVHDPLYRVAEHLPWVGTNLSAVREISDTVSAVAVQVAPALQQAIQIANPTQLTPRSGRIDVTTISNAGPALQRADSAVSQARVRMAGIDTTHLVGPVARAVDNLRAKLEKISAVTDTGARLTRLLPPMLGADGVRNYLVVFQNLAETRATGGIFGSFALIRVEQGKIGIVSQGSASRDLKSFSEPVVELSPNLIALYSDRLSTSPVDVNFTPDFPTAASTFAQMYRLRTGTQVDGVIALDPVVLANLLVGHAPIPIGRSISLTSTNAVQILLSTVYAQFPDNSDVPARDAFLAMATSAGFAAVMSGPGDARSELQGLLKAANERRLLIWSRYASEETDLLKTSLAGSVPVGDATHPTIGVFLNDGTGGKLDYYLASAVKVLPGSCSPESRGLQVAITLKSSVPASGLAPYVIGLAGGGAPGVIRTNVSVMAPAEGRVGTTTVDGRTAPALVGVDHGRSIGIVTVDLPPGGQSTVVVNVSAPSERVTAGTAVSPTVVTTPGVHPWSITTGDYPACRP